MLIYDTEINILLVYVHMHLQESVSVSESIALGDLARPVRRPWICAMIQNKADSTSADG